MKLIILGDVHYTDKPPENRIDDYVSELKRKLRIALKSSLTSLFVLQPGDFTDSPILSYSAYISLANIVSPYKIYTIYGQHDMKYRNKGNTPLDALGNNISNFTILKNKEKLDSDVWLYPCSYDEEVPEIETPDCFNILLIHKMLVHSYELEWMKEYYTGLSFLKKHKYDLIISGDNHKFFTAKFGINKMRYLINCGSLMRSNIDQINHAPSYFIFDTDTRSYKRYLVPINDWSQVFDIEKKIKTEELNEEMKSFVEGLSAHKDMGLNFTENIVSYMKENNVDESVKDIINQSLSM